MGTVRVAGWVATDGPLKGHPNFRIPQDVLYRVAEALRANALPFHLDHDDRAPIETKVIEAEVRPVPEGGLGVWAVYEVDDRYEEAIQARSGFSLSVHGTLAVLPSKKEAAPEVALYTDAASFTEDELQEAGQELTVAFQVRIGPLYQLHAGELAKVVVVFGSQLLTAMPPAVLAAVFVEGLKKLLRRDRPTEIALRVEDRPDGRTLIALIRTDSEEVAQRALEALATLSSEPSATYEFDENADIWRSL